LISLSAILAMGIFGNQAANAAADLPTRTTSQTAVTVAATPKVLSATSWEFELAFNTHSVALDEDPAKTTVLSTDSGQTFVPLKWAGDPTGGHHRKGVLLFKPVTPRPATVELRMTRPGEAQPRLFKWQLNEK